MENLRTLSLPKSRDNVVTLLGWYPFEDTLNTRITLLHTRHCIAQHDTVDK